MPRLLTEGEGVGGHAVAANPQRHLVFAVVALMGPTGSCLPLRVVST
jgi:hypothetical protein